MGDWYIDGKIVDIITYSRAMRSAREEAFPNEPTTKDIERHALNRRQHILNRLHTNRIAEGAD